MLLLSTDTFFRWRGNRRRFILQLADQLMREQKERRSSVEHWMNEGFQQIDQTYKSLLNKATGQESAAQVNHCYFAENMRLRLFYVQMQRPRKSDSSRSTFTPMRTRTTPSSKTNAAATSALRIVAFTALSVKTSLQGSPFNSDSEALW
uniref:Uncharacterized protein n=1 Tax=Ditylenchus dipsaci TaxID=166011 RepID=A0A915EJ40_9BILA